MPNPLKKVFFKENIVFYGLIALFFRYYKAVAAFLSLIYYAGLARFRVGERVERMSYQVHLKYCFLGSHRFEGEGLNSYLKIVLFDIFIIVVLANNEGAALYHLFYAGLILSYLSLKSFYRTVKRCDEGFGLFFRTESGAAVIYGNFDDLHSLAYLAGYESFGIFAKEFVEFRELLVNCYLQTVAYAHLLAVNRNLHTVTALVYRAPSPEGILSLRSCGN